MYAGGGFYHPKFVPEYKVPENKRLSEVLTNMGIDFIRENKKEPFFLFVSHYDVHVQLDADRDLINKYLRKQKAPDYACNAVYAAMIEHVDQSVGDIMDAVDELGLADNTVFISILTMEVLTTDLTISPCWGARARRFIPKVIPCATWRLQTHR